MAGVEIKVRADARQAQTEMGKLTRSMDKINNTAESLTSTFKKLAVGITAAFAGNAFVRGINGAADSLTNLNNKLATVTSNAQQQAKALADLRRVSLETRTSIDGNVTSFQRFSLSLEALGKTQDEVVRFTEIIAKAGAVGGATAEEIKNSSIQLGQGLSAGALRGEELNSVLENNVTVARLIADEMGVLPGQLKALAAEGKITADIVYDAITQT